MWITLLTVPEVNALNSSDFIKLFGNIVEHCPAAAVGILMNRPFEHVDDMIDAVCGYLDGLKLNEKEAILQQYPDTVNKLADLSVTLFDFSTHERINQTRNLRFEEKKQLRKLSKMYKERFGFPFVICAKEKDIDNVINTMETRMRNDKHDEIEAAIKEVKNIANLRIHEIVLQ